MGMHNKKIGYILSAIIIGSIAAVGLLAYKHMGWAGAVHYVTSAQCADCHPLQHASWKDTLHPRMFRPVTSDADILGDFSTNDPAVKFSKDDIQFVVGNKWEQVYVRMVDGEYYPLTAKWMVMQKKWVPYKVEDWHETPMSRKCNGCHVTGFDIATSEFTEFGIGCEACHGPGSKHVSRRWMHQGKFCTVCHGKADGSEQRGDIINSVSPDVCGQCHTRGKNTEQDGIAAGTFDFPIKKGEEASFTAGYRQSSPANDTKGKYWWGFGISKDRHQEYADWNNSKHAKALRNLQEVDGVRGASCSKGKRGDDCMSCHSADYHFARAGNKPTLDTARFGVTCVSCHEPHGLDRKAHDETFNKCGNCHLANFSSKTGGKSHYPCPTGKVSCADCHMPRTVKTGGFFSLRNHAFRIVPPSVSLKEKMPNSCQNGGCHEAQSLDWAIKAFEKHYPGVSEKLAGK